MHKALAVFNLLHRYSAACTHHCRHVGVLIRQLPLNASSKLHAWICKGQDPTADSLMSGFQLDARISFCLWWTVQLLSLQS